MTGSQPVVLKRNKSGQGDWLGSEETYAVKPGVPSEDKRTEHKGIMRWTMMNSPQPWLPPEVISWKANAKIGEYICQRTTSTMH